MTLLQEMQLYFRGERNLGLTLLIVGLLAIAVAFYLWKVYKEPLGLGLMMPVALLAIIGMLAAPLLVKTSLKRSKQFSSMIEKDKVGFLKEETERMKKVNANWIRLKIAWAVMALLSLALIFGVKQEFWVGVAVGFLVLSGVLMTADSFAEKRAERYTQALHKAVPSP
jgi:peptidoglycan/LPS O-acetylase OafA/YrhL